MYAYNPFVSIGSGKFVPVLILCALPPMMNEVLGATPTSDHESTVALMKSTADPDS